MALKCLGKWTVYSWEKRGISAAIDKLHVLSIIININDGYIDISTYYLKAGQSNTSTRTIVYIREYKCLLQFLMRQLGTERNDVKKSLLLEVLIWIFPSKKFKCDVFSDRRPRYLVPSYGSLLKPGVFQPIDIPTV